MMTGMQHAASQRDPDGARYDIARSQPRTVTIILNSGSGADAKQQIRQKIDEALTPSGHTVKIIEVSPRDNFFAVCERAVTQAKLTGGLVAAAGGDGTVNTVAALCCKHDVPMGVIPLGTFNYFSRGLGIPDDPAAAAKVLVDGKISKVTVGYINDHLFLNNASFGLYTRIIRQREEDKSRFGRFRIVALLSAVRALLRGQKPFAIKIAAQESYQLRRTSMVFVGNNTFQLENLELDIADCTRADRLAVVILKPASRIVMARLLLRGAFKNLNGDSHLEMFCTDMIDVESKRRKVDVVVDGELIQCRTPLSFRVARHALKVMVPLQESGE
jgi:diacylglycerol kinase family enzyme